MRKSTRSEIPPILDIAFVDMDDVKYLAAAANEFQKARRAAVVGVDEPQT